MEGSTAAACGATRAAEPRGVPKAKLFSNAIGNALSSVTVLSLIRFPMEIRLSRHKRWWDGGRGKEV